MDILIGCDPEVFVTNGERFVPACGMIPGTKDAPYPVDGGTVQVDGLALEIGIDPVRTTSAFDLAVSKVMDQLVLMLPEALALSTTSVADFKAGEYDALPEIYKVVGCDPDYNAYSGTLNEPAEASRARMAGGHIHIGWTKNEDPMNPAHFALCCRVAQQLDVALGVPSVYEDPAGWRRRATYGKAGAFRPKPYGMEYRSLSNYWVFDSMLRHYVAARALYAVTKLYQGVFFPDLLPEDFAVDIINGADTSPDPVATGHDMDRVIATLNGADMLQRDYHMLCGPWHVPSFGTMNNHVVFPE